MLKLALALLLSLFPLPSSTADPPDVTKTELSCGCKWNTIEPDLTQEEVDDLMEGIDLTKPLPPASSKCGI